MGLALALRLAVLRGLRAGARLPPKCGSTRSFPFDAFAAGFGFRRVAMDCLPQTPAIAGEAPPTSLGA